MSRFLQFDNVAFSYPGMAEPLLGGVTAHFPEGAWTGIVGANGAGKTTLLKLAAGELAPTEGHIHQIGSARYAVQRTDAPPDDWLAFMDSWDPPAMDAWTLLGVEPEWTDRWDSLSHGERKRAQIAAALWRRPDVLALDEPTNHLDAHAKGVLLAALKSFRGVGLLVSHDRDFLDELCSQCLFIFPPRIVMRPGGVSAGMEQDRLEQTRAKEQHDSNAGKARRLQAAAQQRREAAEQSAARTNRLKRKKLPENDHDGRAKRQLAKLTNKDGWGFSQSAALRTRAAKLLAPDAAIRVDYEMGFWLEDSGKSSRNYVAELPEGEIDLGDGRTLVHPALSIRPDDRIALVGDPSCAVDPSRRQDRACRRQRARQVYAREEDRDERERSVREAARHPAGDRRGRVAGDPCRRQAARPRSARTRHDAHQPPRFASRTPARLHDAQSGRDSENPARARRGKGSPFHRHG